MREVSWISVVNKSSLQLASNWSPAVVGVRRSWKKPLPGFYVLFKYNKNMDYLQSRPIIRIIRARLQQTHDVQEYVDNNYVLMLVSR